MAGQPKRRAEKSAAVAIALRDREASQKPKSSIMVPRARDILHKHINGTGAPATYHPVIAEALCDYVANGGTVAEFCEQSNIKGLTVGAVMGWIHGGWNDAPVESFHAAITRARTSQADSLLDEALREARRRPADTADATGQRTHVSLVQWIASKILPQYADRHHLHVSGGLSLSGILADIAGAEQRVDMSDPDGEPVRNLDRERDLPGLEPIDVEAETIEEEPADTDDQG